MVSDFQKFVLRHYHNQLMSVVCHFTCFYFSLMYSLAQTLSLNLIPELALLPLLKYL